MSSYRYLFLGSSDLVADCHLIESEADIQAQARADRLLAVGDSPGIEVWDRDRKVYRARKPDALPVPAMTCAWLAMIDAPRLSGDSKNKLHAVLNHEWPSVDDDLGRNYRYVCDEWFAGLSAANRAIAKRAVEAYEAGNELAAEIASKLPTAPVIPLH
jgi:hypothetical protein